jgi:hypothetical protein
MPRIHLIEKARTSKRRRVCIKCHNEIETGQKFYTWANFRSPPRFKHFTCGHPRPSETTNSAMAAVYEAQEAIDDLSEDASWEDKLDAMQTLCDAVEETAGVYEAAAEQFNQSGENQERYEALDGWLNELQEAKDKLEAVVEALDEAESAMDVAAECPL